MRAEDDDDLQHWFWEEMDVRGDRVVYSIVHLLRGTSQDDMVLVGLQACTMLHHVLWVFGPTQDTLEGVTGAFACMHQHEFLSQHPSFGEARRVIQDLLEWFQST